MQNNKLSYYKENYSQCENLTNIGYDLISHDENGNITKIQHCLLRQKAKKMTDIEISSPFWKAKQNLEVGDVFSIVSIGTATPMPSKQDPNNKVWEFQLKNKASEVEKSCRLNSKILVALQEKLGAKMEDWIGTEIEAKEINKMAKGFQVVWEIK
jgi:hypothetical protein